ncbi:MAG TPA: hypothetical protein VHO69_04720 [Phototrophicaceae bacterium]|nr:hypothetical protein [Phototrophicaceae bacterium]
MSKLKLMKLKFLLMSFFVVFLAQRYVAAQAACTTNGRIVFSSNRDGQFEIYTVNPDGTDLQRLTQNDSADLSPSWSPDGKQIAFFSDVASTFYSDIFVMNTDGGNLINLTNTPQQDELFPIWSPDGKQIVFSRKIIPDEVAIFVMNADGKNVTQITEAGNGGNFPASWSPDGTQIAFISSRGKPMAPAWDTVYGFYRMKPDGTEVNFIPYGGKEGYLFPIR